MFLGEMLIGIDLEGDEPGEVSKCIVYSVRGGSSECIYTLRALSAVKCFARKDVGMIQDLSGGQVNRGEVGDDV